MKKVFVINSNDIPPVDRVSLSNDTHPNFHAETMKTKEYKQHRESTNDKQLKFGNKRNSIPYHKKQYIHIDQYNKRDETETETNKRIKRNQINVVEEVSNGDTDENKRNLQSLRKEKTFFINKAQKRQERFKDIIANQEVELARKKYLAYILGTIFIGLSSTFPLSLIPAHDLIRNPEYWYESIFHGIFPGTLSYIYAFVLASTVLNLNYLVMKQNILFVCLVGNTAYLACFLSSYHIWTQILGNQFPIPLFGFIVSLSFWFLMPLVIWIRFPLQWRQDSRFQKKFMFYFSYIVFTIIFIMILQILLEMIRMADVYNQPFVALALPITREVVIWTGSKLVEKCTNGDERGAKIFHQYVCSTTYSITLCYVLGAFATETTSWILMIFDFSINIVTCILLVWTRKRHPNKIQKQINLLEDLVIGELVEFSVPLLFIFVIAVAFYGPNPEIFGNIGNSYWQFSAIDDIHHTLKSMGLLFLVDFSSTLTSACILWFSSKINLYYAFQDVQMEFGKSFCLVQGYTMLTVIITIVNN